MSRTAAFSSISAMVQSRRNVSDLALLSPLGEQFRYSDVFQAIQEFVVLLNSLGIGRGDRVAIVLPDGLCLALTLLATASAATAAPLNPHYSKDEFCYYFGDLRASALLGDDSLPPAALRAAACLSLPVLRLAMEPGSRRLRLKGEPAKAPCQSGWAEGGDTAFVLHTSGTTSRPKVVPLIQERICITACNIALALDLTPLERCLSPMPLFHVHGILNALLSSLTAGASVICTPGFDPALFFSWIRDLSPTWYTAVPAMHQAVLARGRFTGEIGSAGRLRFVRSSSAPLPLEVLGQLEEFFQAPVIESYGMTEVDQICVNPLPPRSRKPGSVGLPGGPEVAIMDQDGNRLGAGVVGEVTVRGPNVMPGYENAPHGNAGYFFGDFFRTGDQGYFDEDGYLFLTGRLKEIINRGGEKVSPREVDDVLLTFPGVDEAATFAVPHPQLGEEIAALIVAQPERQISASELQEFAAHKLAEFKIPRVFRFVEAIPKGPTGKLRRDTLASHTGLSSYFQSAAATNPALPPRNALESRLHAVWRKVLNMDSFGVRDDFMDLGGSSLLASRLFREIETEFHRSVPLTVVLESSTIEQMAQALQAAGWHNDSELSGSDAYTT